MTNQIWKFEDTKRWIRGFRNVIPVVDSTSAKLMIKSGRELDYYFPAKDIRFEFLEEFYNQVVSGYHGTRRYWHLKIGDTIIKDAAWTYDLKDNRPDFTGYMAIQWAAMDYWYEEEEGIFFHPRNPYHRVDTIQSSRHIEVRVDGVKIVETRKPYLLYETSLPTRYYIPMEDVQSGFLSASDEKSICPYKGVAHYYDVTINGKIYKNIVWYYPQPIPEASKLRGTLAFWPERDNRLEILVDGLKQ